MAASYDQFRRLGVEVLAISTDSIYAHKVFAEISPSARKVQYPLISDRNHKISRMYGVLDVMEGTAPRATFIINPSGIIEYYSVYPGPVGRNIYELIRIFQALQFTEKTGLGAPANWQPGDKGISREWHNVGRV
ncbi:peroxiredoxin (alkyl hydroperoxide reductase subunit C) [Thermosediminibacter litoriperuensis]|uniref:Peroxiredoxin (Alkyl hydroperoxide reductase subunit C) n=1 Tax=Thermosediminibacter litoriperuensis TaxID=291989 RepID=A0A5S5ANQ7_9FIRM|nr:peroxiredoxin (alkyl hydroperoxide reductase subunit C) [Thermosediminibacter litoriperuensis]